MKDMVVEIFIFLKTGMLETKKSNLKTTIKTIAYALILAFSFSFVGICFIFIIFQLAKIDIPKNKVNFYFIKQSLWYTICITNIISPVVEELAFRLSLKYSQLNISLTGAFFGFVISSVFFKGSYEKREYFLERLLFFIFLGIIIYWFLKKNKKNTFLENNWSLNSLGIFYFFTLFFGFYHIVNFDINIKIITLVPVLTLPQIMVGIIFGYIRLKCGILYSIFLHSTYNSLSYFTFFLI